MTIEKAIKKLEKLQLDDLPLPRHQDWQAVQLGIEAIKWIQKRRKDVIGPAAVLLPGETTED